MLERGDKQRVSWLDATMELTRYTTHGLWTVRYRMSMVVKFFCHLAVRAKICRAVLCRPAHVGADLTALLPRAFYGPKRCHQNAHLFIFTPPDAAVRFADGARKSFSIATCLVQDLETGLVKDSPGGEQKRPPVFRLGWCPDKRWQ